MKKIFSVVALGAALLSPSVLVPGIPQRLPLGMP